MGRNLLGRRNSYPCQCSSGMKHSRGRDSGRRRAGHHVTGCRLESVAGLAHHGIDSELTTESQAASNASHSNTAVLKSTIGLGCIHNQSLAVGRSSVGGHSLPSSELQTTTSSLSGHTLTSSTVVPFAASKRTHCKHVYASALQLGFVYSISPSSLYRLARAPTPASHLQLPPSSSTLDSSSSSDPL